MDWWITDTSFGQRLKFVRRFRRMTQRELGIRMGFPEKSADIRIAQYEGNSRIPKKGMVIRFAEILNVSPAVFSQTVCGSCEDLLQSVYWLFLMKGGGDIYGCLDQYAFDKIQLDNGNISPEEFLEKMLTVPYPPSGSPE